MWVVAFGVSSQAGFVVAVGERGECFCGFVFFLLYLLYLRFLLRMVLCVSAFCPSVSELSFLSFVSLYFPSGGCSHVGEVVVFDLEADLFFTVLSFLVKSISWTPRHELLFPSMWVLSCK